MSQELQAVPTPSLPQFPHVYKAGEFQSPFHLPVFWQQQSGRGFRLGFFPVRDLRLDHLHLRLHSRTGAQLAWASKEGPRGSCGQGHSSAGLLSHTLRH